MQFRRVRTMVIAGALMMALVGPTTSVVSSGFSANMIPITTDESDRDLKLAEASSLTLDECRSICEELYAGNPVNTADEKDLIRMCNTVYGLGHNSKGILFSDLDRETDARVQYDTLSFLETVSKDDLTYKYDTNEALEFWHKFYGRNPENPIYQYDYNTGEWKEVTGDTFTIEFDPVGDPPPGFYSKSDYRVYENDSYYLVSGFGQYTTKDYKYAEFLIRKDKWDFPGTLVYAKTGKPKKIPIAKIRASSTLPNQIGKSYSASNMIDGSRKTTWAENKSGVGKGVTITISLNGQQSVHGIAFMNGYHSSVDLYKKNGKVKRISVTANGNKSEYKVGFTKNTNMYSEELGCYNYVAFQKTIDTSTLTIKITDAVAGNKYSDTCISELYVF